MDTIWEPKLAEAAGPKYRAVAQDIRAAIAQGLLAQGARLPPVRELAWKLGITPGTVARAYTVLTDEGALTAGVGRGTFVSAPEPDEPYVPLELNTVPHNSPRESFRVNLFSPVLPEVGQAGLIRELLGKVAQEPASGVMHYPSRPAAAAARRAALGWMADCPLGQIDADDVVLTGGGQHAILLVLQAVLTGRRPTVLVEELAYPGFRRAAELMRADVVPVEMDAHGIIPEALARAARGCDAQILCTSPEVHNPTVVKTPLSRRMELVEVARANGIQILEDDCYRMGVAREASYRLLAPDLGWYISSIAKTLTPALRLGFAVAPPGKVGLLRRAKEHGMFGLPTPMIDLAALLLADPRLEGLTNAARETYARYIEVAAGILRGHDMRYSPDVPFLWLTLPQGWRASAFCQAAEAADVPVRPAEEFSPRDARTPHAVRMAINAGVGIDSFSAAIGRLRRLLDNPPEQIGV
ncbi:transcriptional regulator, GntR family [Sulfitobacter brevis]|uniref:Transcriptional regulator, GntR family n=1 Tax=Sulfitobacter brevis TaxID=74348 RepID=A0A1I1UYH5_9RHOB|nr:PLP-dependent aminotransferase family protein [Sulfitobacter brevis]SFD75857.1 transcriptional regulator, GntR family [Sulfitobacter brevis]